MTTDPKDAAGKRNSDSSEPAEQLSVKDINVKNSSLIMAAGTLTSRILGFVRMALLIAILGTVGASGAFNFADSLPNQVYNLFFQAALSAVLVPELVRALARKNSQEFINRILTIPMTLLVIITIIAMLSVGILANIFAYKIAPSWKPVALMMALWCLPQIFFYGLTALLGQVLNAKGSFGPFMWAPVLNNIVSITGLTIFAYLFGMVDASDPHAMFDPTPWTFWRITLLTAPGTLGVALQALVLIIPLHAAGFRFRPVWGIRGYGLGSVGKTMGWVIAAICVAQVGVLVVSNVAFAANGWADTNRQIIPNSVIRSTAFGLFMLPQSVITISIVTAMFTRVSRAAAAGNDQQVRRDISSYLRSVGILTILSTTGLITLALPICQIVLSRGSSEQLTAAITVLIALAPGLPFLAAWSMVQRAFFAYENAHKNFFIQIPMALTVAFGGILSYRLTPPNWWVPATAMWESAAWAMGCFLGYIVLNRSLPQSDTKKILVCYAKYLVAAIPAGLSGWLVLHILGPRSQGASAMERILGAGIRISIAGSVICVVYFIVLYILKVPQIAAISSKILRKVSGQNNKHSLKTISETKEVDKATDYSPSVSSPIGSSASGHSSDQVAAPSPPAQRELPAPDFSCWQTTPVFPLFYISEMNEDLPPAHSKD